MIIKELKMEEQEKYDNLAQGIIKATQDGDSSLVLLCLTDLNIKKLSNYITRNSDHIIDYVSYDNNKVITGDIGIGDNKIFINPMPQYYNIDDYIGLPKIIVSDEMQEIEKIMNQIRSNVMKKLDNPADCSQKTIVKLLEKELLEYITQVEQNNPKKPSRGNDLNRIMKDSILHGGSTDYSLHPEGVSPWNNDLL